MLGRYRELHKLVLADKKKILTDTNPNASSLTHVDTR